MIPRRISRAPPRSENEGRMHHGVRQHGRERLGGFRVGFRVHQLAGDLGDFLLDQRPQVLHQRRLQRGVFPLLQHARDRQRQAAAA